MMSFSSRQGTVEDDRRNALGLGRPHRRNQGLRIERGQANTVDAAGDEILHQGNLPLAIALLQGSFPNHFHVAELFGCLLGAGMTDFQNSCVVPLGITAMR